MRVRTFAFAPVLAAPVPAALVLATVGLAALVLAAVVLAALVLAAPFAAAADPAGLPTVIDGDTLEVAGQRLDLYGVDAPEIEQTCGAGGRDYPCGIVARAALMDLTAGAEVVCRIEGRTQAGGTAATCFAGGYDLGEGMAHTGWGVADRELTDRYVAVEAQARAARRGLWRGPFVLPREWREGRSGGRSED